MKRRVIPPLLAAALAGCAVYTPAQFESLDCGDARACTALLCGTKASEEQLVAASQDIRHMRQLPAASRDRLVQCTRAAIEAPDRVAAGSVCDDKYPLAPLSKQVSVGPHADDQLMFRSGCPTRRELLLSTAQAWGDDPGGRAVIALAERDKRPGSARLARRARLAAQDPDAIAAAARDVKAGGWDERILAMVDLALAGSAARPHVATIIEVADLFGGDIRRLLLPYVLGSIGGRLAVDRLARDLDSPGANVLATLDALSRLGLAAAAAAPALRRMALHDYLAENREHAAKTYENVTGTPIKPGTPLCPRVVERLHNAWVAELSHSTLRFLPAQQSRLGGCEELADARDAMLAYDAGDTCLLGYNYGEWGGSVVAVDKRTSRQRRIMGGNPEGFAKDGPGAILLFDGGMLGSRVIRLTRGSSGRFQNTWSVDLRDHVVAWKRDETGKLLLLARGTSSACGNQLPYAVLRVGDDRRLTPLR